MTPRSEKGNDRHDDQAVLSNENEEESLSETGVQIQKASTLIPEVIRESVKPINSELSSTEPEEDAQEIEDSSEGRRRAVITPPRAEAKETAKPGKVIAASKDTFGRQETADELYVKVLRAVVSYKREKATYEQYQIYKARTEALVEGKDEAEPQSASPTIEAEREVDELINRAEKIAKERSKRLKEIQRDTLKVSDTIEEARWRVYDLFREQITPNKDSFALRPVRGDQ